MEADLELADYWTSPKVVVKCVGPKLVPFFKTVALYFAVAVGRPPSWLPCLLKCLPVAFLGVFVVLHGISLGQERHSYSRRVLLGLCLSCIGDALLVWPWGFLPGMAAFALAHACYTAAFGLQPLRPWAGAACATLAAAAAALLLPGLWGKYCRWSSLSARVLVWAVPCYSLVLMVMVWRGVSRVRLFGDLWTWTRLCSCIGAVLFAVSDAMLALDAFYLSASPAYARHAVMFTYYAAQLGIALSVVDSRTMAALSVASEAPCRPAACCPGARTPAPRLGQ
ncbi:unnamed protein product [Ixodes pacificus]